MNTTKLTGWAKQIAEVLNCDAAMAEQIFDEMCCSGFDFSEATARQFKRECLTAQQVVIALA